MSFKDVESIGCGEVGRNLLIRDNDGEFEITTIGRYVQRDFIESAPADCPLTTKDSARFVGAFSACLECPLADIVRRD